MNPWLAMTLAILAEVVGTSALKAAEGFSRPWPSVLVIAGYGSAFYFLSQALRSIPLGVAYAMWSGVGTVLITLLGIVLYRQRIDLAGALGIALIIAGVLVLNLLSKAGGH